MKTLGRILIILAAFITVMGITYVIVNAGSSSTSANRPVFERDGEAERSQFVEGMPEFGDDRTEFGEGPMGGIWILGFVKNTAILAIIVMLITMLKKFTKRKSAPVPTV